MQLTKTLQKAQDEGFSGQLLLDLFLGNIVSVERLPPMTYLDRPGGSTEVLQAKSQIAIFMPQNRKIEAPTEQHRQEYWRGVMQEIVPHKAKKGVEKTITLKKLGAPLWVSNADMIADSLLLASVLPPETSAVVGIARSGVIP